MLFKAVGHCYKGIEKQVGNAQMLLKSLWAIKGYRKAAGKNLNTHYPPIGEEAELPSNY
jgi:hypothetical protein